MMTDIIADSLTRIRNAAQRRLDVTTLLHSNNIESIVSILVDKGYLESFKVKELEGNKKTIKVVLKYDENGNLIRYDSSYSYYYSNIENDTLLRDSIFDQFRFHFNQKYFFSEEPFFNDLFFQDSLLKFDFYKNDFFSNRFRSNMEHIDRLFNEMDSIKNQFFMDQFKDKPEIKEK